MAGAHHDWSHDVRASRVRAVAYADTSTRCWRCGLTLIEARKASPERRIVWQAGHTVDGDRHAALLAECSLCNQRAGQSLSAGKARTSSGTGRF